MREIRERYGIPYNTGPLHKQFGSVVRKIVKLALPPLPRVPASGALQPGLDEPAAQARPQKPAAAKTSARKLPAAKTGSRKPIAPKTSARKLPAAKTGARKRAAAA